MIAPIALSCMCAGLVIGFFMLRRLFLLRLWVALILALIAVSILVFTGQLAQLLPPGMFAHDTELAIALLTVLIPPPTAAGLFVGGVTALMLRRHARPA